MIVYCSMLIIIKTDKENISNDQKRELHFMEQLSETNSGEKYYSFLK